VPRSRDEVIAGVSQEVVRFIRNRRQKLEQLRHSTMAVNPFLNPVIMEMNACDTLDDLAEFVVGGHLSEGHATGFGKLVDERIVPNVFGTTKLTGPYRRDNPPYNDPAFSVIDHVVPRPDGDPDLLPLKAGRWSIQLGQALNMNVGFARLVEERDAGRIEFDRIVIGVLYGTEATLTDKFQIARGVADADRHIVVDVRDHVEIRAGREFWAWLNDGVDETQEWVMDGFLHAIQVANQELGSASDAVATYIASYRDQLAEHMGEDGTVDWHALLREING
jgi:hypothetical protein